MIWMTDWRRCSRTGAEGGGAAPAEDAPRGAPAKASACGGGAGAGSGLSGAASSSTSRGARASDSPSPGASRAMTRARGAALVGAGPRRRRGSSEPCPWWPDSASSCCSESTCGSATESRSAARSTSPVSGCPAAVTGATSPACAKAVGTSLEAAGGEALGSESRLQPAARKPSNSRKVEARTSRMPRDASPSAPGPRMGGQDRTWWMTQPRCGMARRGCGRRWSASKPAPLRGPVWRTASNRRALSGASRTSESLALASIRQGPGPTGGPSIAGRSRGCSSSR